MKDRIAHVLRSSSTRTETAERVVSSLYEAAEATPGALSAFKSMAERDLEGYSKELKIFEDTAQAQFDATHKEDIQRLYSRRGQSHAD